MSVSRRDKHALRALITVLERQAGRSGEEGDRAPSRGLGRRLEVRAISGRRPRQADRYGDGEHPDFSALSFGPRNGSRARYPPLPRRSVRQRSPRYRQTTIQTSKMYENGIVAVCVFKAKSHCRSVKSGRVGISQRRDGRPLDIRTRQVCARPSPESSRAGQQLSSQKRGPCKKLSAHCLTSSCRRSGQLEPSHSSLLHRPLRTPPLPRPHEHVFLSWATPLG
jgi:hypothetical protein